MLTNHSTVEGI